MSPRLYSVINAILLQAVWFAAVLAAARGQVWLGVLAALPVLALHAWWHRRQPGAGLGLPAAAVVLGAAVDGALHLAGLRPAGGWPSPWMLAQWAVFATALPASLAWLHGRPLLAAVLGAIGAPVAYCAGMRLGAVAPADAMVLAAVAMAWAIAMPVLVSLPRQLPSEAAHA
jgi:hypothetical protein